MKNKATFLIALLFSFPLIAAEPNMTSYHLVIDKISNELEREPYVVGFGDPDREIVFSVNFCLATTLERSIVSVHLSYKNICYKIKTFEAIKIPAGGSTKQKLEVLLEHSTLEEAREAVVAELKAYGIRLLDTDLDKFYFSVYAYEDNGEEKLSQMKKVSSEGYIFYSLTKGNFAKDATHHGVKSSIKIRRVEG